MADVPPDPRQWVEGSIALQRDGDGVLGGQICLGDVRWWVRAWRQGGDKFHILFQVQAVSDPEFEELRDRLSRRIGG